MSILYVIANIILLDYDMLGTVNKSLQDAYTTNNTLLFDVW